MKERKINDFLVYLNTEIYKYLNYTVRLEAGVQTCEVTLDKKLGSCRDYAWLFVQVLRTLGLAARFVSGYLVQLKQMKNHLMVQVVLKKTLQTYMHGQKSIYQEPAGLDLMQPVGYLQEKDISLLLVLHTMKVHMLLKD